MVGQGRALLALGPRAVLMKGGHLAGAEAVDLLVTADAVHRFAVAEDRLGRTPMAPAARCQAPSPRTSCSDGRCRRRSPPPRPS